VQFWEEKAREKNILLLFTPKPQSPKWVVSDPTKLRQILGNLVSNAIKFTDTGSVRILLSHTGDQLVLEVVDTGIGMEPQALTHIFDAFRQADESTTRRYGGTGLGLAICNGLAVRMDGQLKVRSTLGQGTRFTLNLPLQSAIAPPTLAPSTAWHNTILSGIEVLVAEDNPVNQMVIRRLLERSGLIVRMTSNGLECQHAYHQRQPDLILMDCQMPVCDGYQATQALREAGATLPIIALTANTMPGDKAKCLAAGMSDHSGKPVEISQLLACIERWQNTHSLAS
jgi:CheY-like chemotaxis protein/anti-sigma regulatory factor (Ser/Thr protein kinase)